MSTPRDRGLQDEVTALQRWCTQNPDSTDICAQVTQLAQAVTYGSWFDNSFLGTNGTQAALIGNTIAQQTGTNPLDVDDGGASSTSSAGQGAGLLGAVEDTLSSAASATTSTFQSSLNAIEGALGTIGTAALFGVAAVAAYYTWKAVRK